MVCPDANVKMSYNLMILTDRKNMNPPLPRKHLEYFKGIRCFALVSKYDYCCCYYYYYLSYEYATWYLQVWLPWQLTIQLFSKKNT